MKEENEIDKLFKDKLANANIPDIPQGYLDDISKQLDVVNKKNKNWFGLSSLLIITATIIVAAAGYFIISNNGNSKNKIAVATKKSFSNQTSASENNNGMPATTTTDSTKKSKIVHTNSSNTTPINEKEIPSSNNNELNTTAEKNNENENSHPQKNTGYDKLKSVKSKKESSPISKKNNDEPADEKTLKEHKNAGDMVLDNKESTTTKTGRKTKNIASANNGPSSVNNISDDQQQNNKVLLKEKTKTKKSKKPAIAQANTDDASSLRASKEENTEKANKESDNKTTNLPENKPASTLNNADSVKSATEATNENTVKKDSATAQIQTLSETKKDSITTKQADSLLTAQKDSVKSNENNKGKDTSNAKAGTINKRFTLQASLGTYNVSSTFAPVNSSYDNIRKHQESKAWMYDVNLLLNYTISHFVISTGLNFSQWGEKINYSPTTDSAKYLAGYDTTYTTQKVNKNNIVTNSTISDVYKNKAVANNAVTAHNGINQYDYINIPILVGYTIRGNTFSITPKIGGTAGVPIKSKGYYINSELNGLVEEKSVKWLFNYQVSLDIKYRNISIIPFYRKNTSALINSSPTSNTYSGWGIQLGYTFKLK